MFEWANSGAAAVRCIAIIAVAGCGNSRSGTSTGERDEISLASGDGQIGPAGSEIAEPLIVVVEHADGTPIQGVSVNFFVTEGGGSINPKVGQTDSIGRAQTILTLGKTIGTNAVEARLDGFAGSPIVFTMGQNPETALEIVSGSRQVGTPNTELAAPLVILVVDKNHQGVPGATVEFSVTSGGGALSTSRAITDALGQAQAKLTLGPAKGIQTVNAISDGLLNSPLKFTASMASYLGNVDFATGTAPISVLVEDFNNDGKPDVATANNSSNSISLLFNTTISGSTTPTFTAKADFSTGASPFFLVANDFNGDGKRDVVVANQGSNTFSVFLNVTSTGSISPVFSPKVDFPTGASPRALASRDINGDGKADIVVTNFSAGTASARINTTANGATTPSFGASVEFGTGAGPIGIVLSDINGDNKPDITVANSSDSTVSILLNTTASGSAVASFATRANFPTGSFPLSIIAGDFDSDNKLDIATANVSNGNVSVLVNTTATSSNIPSLASKIDSMSASAPQGLASADLNSDGRPDLVNGSQASGVVSVLLNTSAVIGAPLFTGNRIFGAGGTGTQAVSVSIGDINGDGSLDIVAANISTNRVAVLLSQ
jgi:hypothetical protein